MRQNYSGREANTGLTTAIAEKGSDAGKWLGETLASGAKSQWDTIKAISDKIPSLPKTVSEPVVRALKESAEEVAGNLGAGPALKRTIGGAAQGTGETAAGFVSPAALAGGGAIKAGGTLAQLAKRAFAAQMVSQAPEAYAQAVHAVKYGNESDISRSLVNLASATALPLAIVHAELTGKPAPMMPEGEKPGKPKAPSKPLTPYEQRKAAAKKEFEDAKAKAKAEFEARRRGQRPVPKPVVPETPPEPERALIEEIRQRGLKTKAQIQSAFPQLTREHADFRDQAWGKPEQPAIVVPPEVKALLPKAAAATEAIKAPAEVVRPAATTADVLGTKPVNPPISVEKPTGKVEALPSDRIAEASPDEMRQMAKQMGRDIGSQEPEGMWIKIGDKEFLFINKDLSPSRKAEVKAHELKHRDVQAAIEANDSRFQAAQQIVQHVLANPDADPNLHNLIKALGEGYKPGDIAKELLADGWLDLDRAKGDLADLKAGKHANQEGLIVRRMMEKKAEDRAKNVGEGSSQPEAALKTAAELNPEGAPNASRVTSPASVSQPEVRPQVGQKAPLRQQGEAPGAPPQDVRPPGAGEVPKVAAIFTKDNPPPLYSKAMWKGEEVEIATGVGMDGKVRVQGFIHDQRVPVEELQSIQSEVAAPPAAPAVANPLPSPEPIPEKPVGAKSAQTRQRNKAGGVQSPTSAPKSVFESLDDIDAAVAAKKITPAQAVKARNALLKKSGQKPPEEPPTPGITSMGGLAPSDPTEPAGKGLPSVEELLAGGGGTATRPATPTTAQGFMASMRDAFSGQRFSQAFKGWLGGMAGETMPKTTVQDRLSGELGARFLASPIAARHVAEVFSGDVLGADVDPNQFGAALSEDNLRSIKAGLPPEEAENVFSFIGKEDSPFATEEEYQAYLQQPEVKAAIARHKENWTNIVEPMYREAMKIDPDEELPSRGQQTGARVNLNANPDEKTDIVTTQPRGNLMGTLTKKSPFGRKAYGSGKNYGMNYTDLMHQTFTRQLEIANKNAFEAQLVKSGNAKIAKPGLRDLTLGDGSATKEVPLKRQTIIKDGKRIPVNRSLYIRQNLASEYLTAANVHPNQFAEKINGALNKFINTSALAGLTDASVHVSNLSSALLTRPGPGNIIRDSLLSLFGRADIPLTIARTLRKAVADNSTQTAALAEMGALKGGSPSKGRLLGRVSNFIQRADKTVRLSLDDVYKSLVAQGLQENTETTRREFVNQVGQYSKRAQGPFVRFLRDSGFGPFVTAGRTFNTLGFRMATLNPGGKATSPSAAAIMRLNLASKWIGTAVFIGGLNYLFTGKPGGRPGTPIGTVDTGKDTDEGKPITVPVARMFGLDRAMRVTGLKGFANAKALGLDTTTALDSAGRDVINAAISPAAGPPVRLGVGAATGYSPAVRVGRQFPLVAPGQSQFVSDAKNALLEANPIAGTIHAAMQPNANVLDAARRSFPSFAPQAGKAPDMVANYPRIVSRAQLNDYITDVAKRARGMSSEARSEYLKQSADSVPDDLKKDFWAQMKRRKVQ
jgi:hypothetical protein